MKKPTLILVLFISVGCYAQIELIGKVVDSLGVPVEFANVVLTNAEGHIITGAITDSKGVFTLSTKKGDYTLSVSFIGYIDHTQPLQLASSTTLLNIILKNDPNLIDEVVITAQKPIIERKVDRLIFHVENSIAAAGGTALDALRITPRIKVQNEQISMIGKGSMMILINDRLIKMSGEELSDYLKSLNADEIKSIEVISNPPAKYSAEGNSGLINIVLKRLKTEAWNTSISSIYQQATYAKARYAVGFNMKKGKFQLNTSIRYTNGSNAPRETYNIIYPKFLWEEIIKTRHFADAKNFKIALDYELNKSLTTGVSINLIDSKRLSKEFDNTNFKDLKSTKVDSMITTTGRRSNKKFFYTFNYHFIYKLDNIDRKASLDFDYFNYKNRTNRTFNTQTFLPNNQPIPNSLEKAINFGNQDIKNYSINLDMEHPTNWANLNYGARVSFTETENSFNYFDIVNEDEMLNTNFSNQFHYTENTQALYFSIQKSFSENWEAKGGLRYEFTQTEGFSKNLNQTHNNDYSKLFPTVYIAYSPNDNHSFGVNYGRRISRPGFGLLNPFRWVSNPYSYSEGNPFLKPSFSDNFELEYSYKTSLITKFFYSYNDDVFERVSIINGNTNVEQVKPLNFIINKMFGITQTFIFKPVKWWKVNASADVYYSDTSSKIPETLQQLNGWNFEFNYSNDLALNQAKTLFLGTNLWLMTNGVHHLDQNSNDLDLDASLKWFLLNKKLTLSIVARDLVNPKGARYTSFSNGIKLSSRNYFDEQYFRITARYLFGDKFNQTRRNNRNQNEQDRTY